MIHLLTASLPPEGDRLSVPLAQLAPGELEELVLWLPGSWLGARTVVWGATRGAGRGASMEATRGANRGASWGASWGAIRGANRGSSKGSSWVERSLQQRGVLVAEIRGILQRLNHEVIVVESNGSCWLVS